MKKAVFLTIAAWVAITFSLVIYNEAVFVFGKEITLKVRPIDPRDFLRGDYVALGYEINKAPKTSPYIYGDGYVLLKENNEGIYEIKKVSKNKPQKGEIYIKAKIKGKNIEYPSIQKYFTKTQLAKKLEKDLIKGGYAKISLTKNGSARIKEITLKK